MSRIWWPGAPEVPMGSPLNRILHAGPWPRLRLESAAMPSRSRAGARPPLSSAARAALADVARGYSSLEFDLDSGKRGERGAGVERWLTRLTGAEAALAVNNGAAALLVTLSALAAGRAVLVSRGELVEIGGSFRIPEILEQSGAALIEVGTPNRTHLRPDDGAH